MRTYKLEVEGFAVELRSADELSPEERRSIAEAAMRRPIYFNELEFYHWFFDFKHEGRWIGSLEIDSSGMALRVDGKEA